MKCWQSGWREEPPQQPADKTEAKHVKMQYAPSVIYVIWRLKVQQAVAVKRSLPLIFSSEIVLVSTFFYYDDYFFIAATYHTDKNKLPSAGAPGHV